MPAKRIILMYISEVSGHHSATLAVEKALKILSPHAETLNINAFNYTNPISEKIVNQLYMSIIKNVPHIWEYLYDNPDVAKKIEKFKNIVHKSNSPKLKKLFDQFKPDIVLCSQAFPCGMVADFKKTYNSSLPLVAVLTDYVPHSYWVYDTVDYYITPSEEITAHLIKKGVQPYKIKSLGIPVDPKFNERVHHNEVMSRLHLNQGIPTLLLMGGGHGLGPIKTIIKSLEKIKKDFQEIIVTGTNKKTYASLKRKVKKYRRNTVLLKFVNNIHELMAVSSIIITKPGGLTTAEALTKKLPMIIIRPLPGQELCNSAYLTQKRAAAKVDDPKDITPIIDDLLSSPEKLKQMSECAGRISKPNASFDIARLLLREARPYV